MECCFNNIHSYLPFFQNQTLGLKKIADFFGFSLSEEEIQTVVEKSGFKAMKEKSSKTHGTFGKIIFCKGKFRKTPYN